MSIAVGLVGAALIVAAMFIKWSQFGSLLDFHSLRYTYENLFWPLVAVVGATSVLLVPVSTDFRRGVLLALGAMTVASWLALVLDVLSVSVYEFHPGALIGMFGGVALIVSGLLAREVAAQPSHGYAAPAAAPAFASPQTRMDAPAASVQQRRCPDCAETVRADARFCPYCGYDLSRAGASSQ